MPKWVKKADEKKRSIKNVEKLRRNQPKEDEAEEAVEVVEAAIGE